MGSVAVVNASPLIFLSRADRLDILQTAADRLMVPEPVVSEVYRRGPLDPTAKALRAASWLAIERAPEVPENEPRA